MILRLPSRCWISIGRTRDDDYDVIPRSLTITVGRSWSRERRAAYYSEGAAMERAIDVRYPELAPDTTPFLDMLKRTQAEMPPRRFTWTDVDLTPDEFS